MVETGHRTQCALKTMLFKKDLKMSEATNKDFSASEVRSIIMGESNVIWTFIYTLPDYIECPCNLIVASYYTFTYIGWYGLIIFLFTLFVINPRGGRQRGCTRITTTYHTL